MLIIVLPAVILLMYYVGFITMTKLKIKQNDDSTITHFLRMVYGFLSLAVFSAFLMLLKWLLIPILKRIYHIE